MSSELLHNIVLLFNIQQYTILHYSYVYIEGNELPIRQICDVKPAEKCIILGTTFKHMELQPSILKELSDELNIEPQPVVANYTSEDDVLYLEDMLQRIVLTGEVKDGEFVTGEMR